MKLQSPFHRLPLNERGRDFVVGDVHGHRAMLDRLLEVVEFDRSSDRLIALGDLIDRGPDSAALIERVGTEPWFYSLRGNHEAMMQQSLTSFEAYRIWNRNDSSWHLSLPSTHFETLVKLVDGMPLAIELPLPDGRTVGLIHAEVRIGYGWDDVRQMPIDPEDAYDDITWTVGASALWGRTRVVAWAQMRGDPKAAYLEAERKHSVWDALQPIPGIDQVIAGHSILAKRLPVAISNLVFLDTGAYQLKGRLTLYEPLTGFYWQVGNYAKGLRVFSRKPRRLAPPRPLSQAYRPKTREASR